MSGSWCFLKSMLLQASVTVFLVNPGALLLSLSIPCPSQDGVALKNRPESPGGVFGRLCRPFARLLWWHLVSLDGFL